MIAQYIARQFSRPSGLVGWVIGRGMARHNEREARWTVDLLAIELDARVLEVGFGPGVAVQYAASVQRVVTCPELIVPRSCCR